MKNDIKKKYRNISNKLSMKNNMKRMQASENRKSSSFLY